MSIKPVDNLRVVILLCTAVSALRAQTLTILHSFAPTDGVYPNPGLALGIGGNSLYGTAENGGANRGGTVFEITENGSFTALYLFCAQSTCPVGQSPHAGLARAANGEYYGTAWGGGPNSQGTVYKINPGGSVAILYQFCSIGRCLDGDGPNRLIQAADGNFYGTTEYGGTNDQGTVFKITPSGAFTTLYSFCPQSRCPDGSNPLAALVQAADGNFYGTTRQGGLNSNDGTVFKITPSGTLTTLYTFCAKPGCADGSFPVAGLIQATDGNFYGTTTYGGAPCYKNGCGTVFTITPTGTLTTLYRFCPLPGCADGGYAQTALVQATDGNFYGTTGSGGAYGRHGTIFKMAPAGALTTLYSFCAQSNCPDGEYPNGLVQAANGTFYGTTTQAGANGWGTVFSLSVNP